MTTFAVAFKEHVRRLARKEIRAATAVLRRATTTYRRDIARLKRELTRLQRALAASQKAASRGAAAPQEGTPDELAGARFSARSVKAQRRRLGLSAADYGKLLGVSGLTVYHWESGKARPRRKQMAALVAVRGIGKRDALARLGAAEEKPKARRRRRAA